jgi:hypothetical protein
MVHDNVWRSVCFDPGRRLCEDCLRNRMRRMLGRDFRLKDLTFCPWNHDYFQELVPDVKALAAADLPHGQSALLLTILEGQNL